MDLLGILTRFQRIRNSEVVTWFFFLIHKKKDSLIFFCINRHYLLPLLYQSHFMHVRVKVSRDFKNRFLWEYFFFFDKTATNILFCIKLTFICKSKCLKLFFYYVGVYIFSIVDRKSTRLNSSH